jgi:hypothetical protein
MWEINFDILGGGNKSCGGGGLNMVFWPIHIQTPVYWSVSCTKNVLHLTATFYIEKSRRGERQKEKQKEKSKGKIERKGRKISKEREIKAKKVLKGNVTWDGDWLKVTLLDRSVLEEEPLVVFQIFKCFNF